MLRLRFEREKTGMSRAAFARKSSIGESNYSTIESGRRTPYEPELERIAKALGWPYSRASELLQEIDEQ